MNWSLHFLFLLSFRSMISAIFDEDVLKDEIQSRAVFYGCFSFPSVVDCPFFLPCTCLIFSETGNPFHGIAERSETQTALYSSNFSTLEIVLRSSSSISLGKGTDWWLPSGALKSDYKGSTVLLLGRSVIPLHPGSFANLSYQYMVL